MGNRGTHIDILILFRNGDSACNMQIFLSITQSKISHDYITRPPEDQQRVADKVSAMANKFNRIGSLRRCVGGRVGGNRSSFQGFFHQVSFGGVKSHVHHQRDQYRNEK